jgi:hypothetical protein
VYRQPRSRLPGPPPPARCQIGFRHLPWRQSPEPASKARRGRKRPRHRRRSGGNSAPDPPRTMLPLRRGPCRAAHRHAFETERVLLKIPAAQATGPPLCPASSTAVERAWQDAARSAWAASRQHAWTVADRTSVSMPSRLKTRAAAVGAHPIVERMHGPRGSP